MSDDPIKLTDEAVEKFFGSLVLNFISSGEAEAEIIENGKLSQDQQTIVMKSNTLFTVATMYLMTILQDKDLDSMRKVLTVWSQPMIQDLVNIAFKDDIDAAKDSVEKAIESMEKEANKDEQSE
jgi:hypothetical protein